MSAPRKSFTRLRSNMEYRAPIIKKNDDAWAADITEAVLQLSERVRILEKQNRIIKREIELDSQGDTWMCPS